MIRSDVPPEYRRFPPRWEVKPFSSVFKDKTSGNPKVQKNKYLDSGALPVVDQGQELVGGYTDDVGLAVDSSLPCVLFGDHTRIFKFIDFPFALGADGVKLLQSDLLLPRFAYHYLCQLSLPIDAGYSRHFKFLKRTFVPIPPEDEQRRIAAILDKADAIRRKRKEAIKLTEDFLRSTFLEMFGDPVTNPKGWEVVTVGDVVSDVQDGPHVSPEYAEEGIPFLSTRNIRPGRLVLEDMKYVSEQNYKELTKRFKPRVGDVLLTKGGTTGYAKAVDFSWPFAVWVHLAVLRPKPSIRSEFLEATLNTPNCYRQSQKYTHGITNKDLGLTRIRKIKLSLPSLKLQDQYCRIREIIVREIKRIEVACLDCDNLFSSLVHRAFRGELNTSDPNDEPVEELLERIREKRGRTDGGRKTGK